MRTGWRFDSAPSHKFNFSCVAHHFHKKMAKRRVGFRERVSWRAPIQKEINRIHVDGNQSEKGTCLNSLIRPLSLDLTLHIWSYLRVHTLTMIQHQACMCAHENINERQTLVFHTIGERSSPQVIFDSVAQPLIERASAAFMPCLSASAEIIFIRNRIFSKFQVKLDHILLAHLCPLLSITNHYWRRQSNTHRCGFDSHQNQLNILLCVDVN